MESYDLYSSPGDGQDDMVGPDWKPETPLSVIDKLMPPANVRFVLAFPLEIADKSVTTTIITEAFQRTVMEIVILDKLLVHVSEKGVNDFMGKGNAELAFEDLSSVEKLDFELLESKNFPPNSFDDRLFLAPPVTLPGDAVFSLQATFVCGGLLLGFSICHLALDGASDFIVTQRFSIHCNDIAAGTTHGHRTSYRTKIAEAFSRSSSSTNPAAVLEDHPGYSILPAPPGDVPIDFFKPMRSVVYRISKEAVHRLKTDCSSAYCSSDRVTDKWNGTGDALCALMYRSTIAAQLSAKTIEPDTVTHFSQCVDVRNRAQPPLGNDFIGNAFMMTALNIPMTDLLETYSLADIAHANRVATDEIHTTYISDTVIFLHKVPDMRCVMLDIVKHLFTSQAMVVTSWRDFDYYGLDFGGVLGKPMTVRPSNNGIIFPGAGMILPQKGDGEAEVMLCLEPHVIECLEEEDNIWMSYVDL